MIHPSSLRCLGERIYHTPGAGNGKESLVYLAKQALSSNKTSWIITFGLFTILVLTGIGALRRKENDIKILDKREGYSKFIYKTPSGTSCHLPQEGSLFELNVEGDYNIENSLAAINLGYKLGMSYEEIKSGLAKYRPIEKRWEIQKIGNFNIINDSYNANPESMKAAVSTFIELYKNSVVVLGNMGELGENEIEFHREVGRYIAEKFDSNDADFITVGNLALYLGEELEKQGFNVKHFDNNLETSRYILDNLHGGCTIFLKASRTMKFEEIIEGIKR